MKSTTGFSIAMATYNGEPFLQEQLDSLARQTLPPLELVVCDDCSTDATVSILRDFAARAPFDVRIYENERNLGYGDNFMKAASLCNGDWIAFCDQDDIWLDYKLERYTEVIVAHPEADLLSHSAQQVDARLKPLRHRMPDHKRFSIVGPLGNRPLSVLTGFTCCVRKAILDQVPANDRPPDIHHPHRRQAHDSFIYHIVNSYGHIARMADSLALYRRHNTAVSGEAGSPVHRKGITITLERFRKHGGALRFAQQAMSARHHRDFYQRICKARDNIAPDELFIRSAKAAHYYEFVARAYTMRAALRASRGLFQRLAAFSGAVRVGTYTGSAGGSGIGLGHFLHDLVRTFIPQSHNHQHT